MDLSTWEAIKNVFTNKESKKEWKGSIYKEWVHLQGKQYCMNMSMSVSFPLRCNRISTVRKNIRNIYIFFFKSGNLVIDLGNLERAY